MSRKPVSRRSVLGAAAATSILAACGKSKPKEGEVPTVPPETSKAQMPMRELGSTGVKVSAVGIGGYHIGSAGAGEGERIVRSALDRGITFLDNCWDYHGGKSEEIMGRALQDGYRAKAFLMTKIDGRTKDAARAQLEQSLTRLKTDHIDLVQVHEVIRPGDPVECFAPGGCMEALVEAKKAGKIRFIGFTGHKHPDIHTRMLDVADEHGFAFDTVQMPLNVMDAHFTSFEQKVLPRLVAKKIGVLGMKAMGAGNILKSKTATPIECLHYALNLPTSVVITGCDSMGVLDQAIHAALTFAPMPPAVVQALLARTAEAAKDGKLESFKTTGEHDGTAKNPKWLTGSEV